MAKRRYTSTILSLGTRWTVSRPSHFTTGETAPSTHCIGGWKLWRREKSVTPPGNQPPSPNSLAQSLYRMSYVATLGNKANWSTKVSLTEVSSEPETMASLSTLCSLLGLYPKFKFVKEGCVFN
jgi:hypothetical protein